ncbi:hypothetical protein E1B28_010818 [Marasmius oreades]|uniref:Uncharacterized protein n=1 Tax=Marasmius oreades TaxID=181124 RepID=A0A9P7RST3_9AGAR|nr:uncharacterized protein E1B28_010818 [Marasmius oreades]KAG7089109.1 hypothetical protein E1B28_010818 [Marasmius oreades]
MCSFPRALRARDDIIVIIHRKVVVLQAKSFRALGSRLPALIPYSNLVKPHYLSHGSNIFNTASGDLGTLLPSQAVNQRWLPFMEGVPLCWQPLPACQDSNFADS